MQQDGALRKLPNMAAFPGDPVPDMARVPKTLDNSAKAAIIVRLLLNEGADLPLEDLPEDLQAKLTARMGSMGLVDRTTLATVLHEFAEALDGVGLAFPKGLAGALSALEGKISPQTAARLRKEAGVRQAGDPWERLCGLTPEELAEMAQAESVEVAAVLLSKLDTPKAAAMLAKLPGPLARQITYAVSQTEAVTPEAVDRIGLSLASQLDHRPIPAFSDAPGERVGAILNQSPASTRDEMLTALDETDADFANVVRKSIFTFAHIPERIGAVDVPAIIRAVDQGVLVTALAAATEGGDAEAAEYLLSNMSSRMADNMREEIAERGKIKARDGEAAMTEIVAAIRDLAAQGTLTLVAKDEGEDEDDA